MKGSEETEMVESGAETEASIWEPVIWDCGSPLYDSYELASLANLIERHSIAPPLDGSIQFAIPTSSNTSRISNSTMLNVEDVHNKEPSGKFSGFESVKRWRLRERSEKVVRLCSRICSICSLIQLYNNFKKKARVIKRRNA